MAQIEMRFFTKVLTQPLLSAQGCTAIILFSNLTQQHLRYRSLQNIETGAIL